MIELAALDNLVEGYAYLADSGRIKPLFLAQGRVTSGALHPSGNSVAVGTAQGTVAVLNLQTGEIR